MRCELRRRCLPAVIFLSLIPSGCLQATSLQAIPLLQFQNGLGVNTHIYALNSAYGNIAAVIASLNFIGIEHIRDNPPANANPARYLTLARAGIGLDLIARSNQKPDLALYEAVAAQLDSVEGPNEVNAHPNSFFYQGLSGIPAAIAFQPILYNAIKHNPALQHVPVLMFSTVHRNTSDLPPYANAAPYADAANVHAYAAPIAAPPSSFIPSAIKRGQAAAPGKPVILTEFGYYTLAQGTGVPDDLQAKWLLDALADNILRNHVQRQYIYELSDTVADGAQADKENHFGLYDYKWQPKPAALALHRLWKIMATIATNLPPAMLDVDVAGLPSDGAYSLLQGQGQEFYLLIWAEPDMWDGLHHQKLAVPGAKITIAVSGSQLSLYNPLASLQMVKSGHGKLAFNLSDDLLIVKIIAPHAHG